MPDNMFPMKTHRFPELTEILNRQKGLRLAILFGSLATGRATPESDIDLAVDLGTPMNAEQKMQLISDLATVTGRPIRTTSSKSPLPPATP